MNPAVQAILARILQEAWKEVQKDARQDQILDFFEEIGGPRTNAACQYARKLLDIEEIPGSPWSDEPKIYRSTIVVESEVDTADFAPKSLAPKA